MKRVFAVAGFVVLVALTSMAQQRVVLENADTAMAFGGANAFVDAYNAASDGDTLYLPGLQFSVPSPFEKQLTIYGAGYHPDHTEATGQTRLSGNLNLGSGASGSHFEGLYFNNNISYSAEKIDNLTFTRCYFGGNITLDGLAETPSENINISESVIMGSINGRRTSGLALVNYLLISDIYSILTNIENGLLGNNVIVGQGYSMNRAPWRRDMIENIADSLFENNIFYNRHTVSYTFRNVANNTFNNNVFNWNPTGDANNTWNNNYTGVSIPDIFFNYTGNSFSFEADYNLADPDTYQGTTGNQVGIYGGHNPFKANTRPSNPQILSVEIGHGTDDEGMLHVELEVEAQER